MAIWTCDNSKKRKHLNFLKDFQAWLGGFRLIWCQIEWKSIMPISFKVRIHFQIHFSNLLNEQMAYIWPFSSGRLLKILTFFANLFDAWGVLGKKQKDMKICMCKKQFLKSEVFPELTCFHKGKTRPRAKVRLRSMLIGFSTNIPVCQLFKNITFFCSFKSKYSMLVCSGVVV